MTALQIIEKKGNEAVQRLRLQKLRSGHPFMINSKDLEPNQCYLEYPDGSIQLVFLKNAAKEFTVIMTLSTSDEISLRRRYGLSDIFTTPTGRGDFNLNGDIIEAVNWDGITFTINAQTGKFINSY